MCNEYDKLIADTVGIRVTMHNWCLFLGPMRCGYDMEKACKANEKDPKMKRGFVGKVSKQEVEAWTTIVGRGPPWSREYFCR